MVRVISMWPAGAKGFTAKRLNKVMLWVVTAFVLAFAFFPNYGGFLIAGGGDTLAARDDLEKVVVKIDGMSFALIVVCYFGIERRVRNEKEMSKGARNMTMQQVETQRIVTGTPFLLVLLAVPAFAQAGVASLDSPFLPGIVWERGLDVARARSGESKKPVVVIFHAIWCASCGRFKRETLTAPEVLEIADRFHWVAVDIDRELSLARAHQVQAVPTTQVVLSSGKMAIRFSGYATGAELRSILTRVEADARNPAPSDAAPRVWLDDPTYAISGERSDLVWRPSGYRSKSICFSQVGYGPLNLDSQSPFPSLRLGLRPRTPSTLGRGDYELRVRETWSSIWAQSAGEYLLDYETTHTSLTVGYGLRDTMHLELEVADRNRFGGHMDTFIQNFHDLFGINQSGRDLVPNGNFAIDMSASGSDPAVSLTPDDRGSFSNSIALTFQHNITCGTETLPALSYAVTVRHNTRADDIQGGDNLDLGVSVAAARRFGNFHGYVSLGYAYFGDETFRGIQLNDSQFSMLGAVEWRYRNNQSFLLQYLLSEGVAENFTDFSRFSNEITLGWKYELVRGTTIEVGLIENIFVFDNSPDFGVHAGVTTRF